MRSSRPSSKWLSSAGADLQYQRNANFNKRLRWSIWMMNGHISSRPVVSTGSLSRDQGRTEVRWRQGHKASLAPPVFEPEEIQEQILLYWRK